MPVERAVDDLQFYPGELLTDALVDVVPERAVGSGVAEHLAIPRRRPRLRYSVGARRQFTSSGRLVRYGAQKGGLS